MVDSSSPSTGGSRVISRLLPLAIRLWLSTQVDRVENLVFRIEGGDRTLLSGHIPEVVLSAQAAVYQGIHLSQAALKATDIRINLGQVIRRKPLRLLAPFPVSGRVEVTTEDLNRSLQEAPLLGEGLYDFLRLLANSQPEAAYLNTLLDRLPKPTLTPHYQASAHIQPTGIDINLHPKLGEDLPPIALSTQLVIKDGHRLCLENPHWIVDAATADKTALPELHGFEIDLGSKITLTDCTLERDRLSLAGTIRIMP